MLDKAGHSNVRCLTDAEFLEGLERGAAAVLIAQELLVPPLASGLCEFIARQPAWSDLPVILVAQRESRPNDELVAALGNVSILSRPMSPQSLTSAVSAALRARARQFQVRELLTAQAEQVRRKDEFLAMLAHELRNPLGPVRFAAKAIMLDKLEPAKLASLAGLVERQVEHMARLIDQLLDVTRVSRGVIQLEVERLDFAALAGEAVQAQRAAAAHRQVRLTESLEAPAWVEGDPTRLRQVIDNLLENALKFSVSGGQVHVEVSRLDGEVRLRVSDTGEGIDPQTLPCLFEPFMQADRTLDRAKGGLGLGLALVKGLIGLHHGTVAARSEGRGRGSQFTVTLPASPPPERAEAPGAEHGAGGPVQVLIAEDNVDAAEALRLLLELRGFEVCVAHCGDSAVELARGRPLDAIVCDIGLPGRDGYEVARTVRADPVHRDTLLLAITGYGSPEDRQAALAAGFDAHFAKPVEPTQLLARLEALTA